MLRAHLLPGLVREKLVEEALVCRLQAELLLPVGGLSSSEFTSEMRFECLLPQKPEVLAAGSLLLLRNDAGRNPGKLPLKLLENMEPLLDPLNELVGAKSAGREANTAFNSSAFFLSMAPAATDFDHGA